MKRIIFGLLTLVFVHTAVPVFSAENEPIANYQVHFSPDDQIAEKLIALIATQKKSIKAAVYCLMHRGIAKALMDAHERGVQVEVIVDPYSVKSNCPVKKMGAAHLPVFVWNPPLPRQEGKGSKKAKQRKPLMHDKFCVFGDSQVWTGSFNFTFQATHSNRENVVVLESPQIASLYLEEFERLKKAGCVSLSDYLSPKGTGL